MKKIKIRKAIEKHTSKENYVRLTRKKGGFRGITTGFILKMSSDFILIQETDEFRILGYQIIPIKTIKHVRRNKNDKTYENILFQEGLINQVGIKHKIDLSSWCTIMKSVQKTGLTVISECEHPDLQYFCIGQIKRIGKKSVSIRYFNAQGVLDKKNTKNYYSEITKLSFDDRYANVFSKYVK